jgi:SSS family solute:Na+ symporter/sodium/pantothenate symporter
MTDLQLGPGAMTVLAVYLLSLLLVGMWGRLKRVDDSMSDHYLGGRDLGFAVLLLTLFATQYSGNTLFGFTGQAYRIGYAWLASVHAVMFIVVGYLAFAPKLYSLSRREGFITPADYVRYRFPSRTLRLLVTLCMLFALANYTLAQLKVMGHAVEGLSGGRLSALEGIVALAAVMVVYETLGGMRSVAWTDAIQGILLFLGFALIFVLVENRMGGLGAATRELRIIAPEKIAVPDLRTCVGWLSFVILIGVGGSIYPQAIQRIFAARLAKTLRHSLSVMAVLPLVSVLAVFALGIIAIVQFPGLGKAESDQVLALILRDVMSTGALGYWVVVMVLAAIVAALMSTADSALLTISSMVSHDIYGVYLRPKAGQGELTRVGKYSSWAMIALMVWVSTLENLTLVDLLVLKFEVLVQVAPAFYLGLNWPQLRTSSVLSGLIVGLTVSLTFWALGASPLGVHPGVFGLLANVSTIIAVHWFGNGFMQKRARAA